MKARRWFYCGGLIAALLIGCKTGPRFDARQTRLSAKATVTNLLTVVSTNQLDDEWLRPSTNFFTLGPGDQLEIEVMGDPATRTTTVVGPDGKIYYYLLSGLDVWGLTLAQTKELLERELTKFIREEPRVALTLRAVESKRLWLLGRLNSPGVYVLATPMSLLESISLAGGPSTLSPLASLAGGASPASFSGSTEDVADLQRSFVIRNGRVLPVDFYRLLREGDLSQNIYLQADDFVYLPTAAARDVYVLGAVGQPRAVPFGEPLTLISAIANAGGTIKNAYLSHVAIVRGTLTEPQIAIVDFQAIVKGAQPNVLLEPRDIVYVPFTPYRTLARYLDLIVTTFARTVGANEGAHAVVRGAQPVGVNVPIGF